MKKIALLFVTLLSFSFQEIDPKFEKAMQDALQKMNNSRTIDDWREAANQFERIGQKAREEWLPRYYQAYCHIIIAAQSEGTAAKDAALDPVRPVLDALLKEQPKESEVVALNGFWYMIRLSADAANRGQSLSPLTMQELGKAVAMNPGNPRAMLLMGQMQLGTAQFFGSDTAPACAMIAKAKGLFQNEQPVSAIHPAWGKQMAEGAAQDCP